MEPTDADKTSELIHDSAELLGGLVVWVLLIAGAVVVIMHVLRRRNAPARPVVWRFNAPPGWPALPPGFVPPHGWQPDPSWPAAPPHRQWWIPMR